MTRHRLSFIAPTLDSATSSNGAQNFNTLANRTQLSARELARLLRVRVDTIMHWRTGRRVPPEGVLHDLREYLGMDTDA